MYILTKKRKSTQVREESFKTGKNLPTQHTTKQSTVHTLELVAASCVSSGARIGAQTTAFNTV